ncbi:acyl carrier protein [Frankia sp. AgPm24]|uniref:Acyl carrier protein n=1 Tax=Frankia umida TaxID=573489 RepID=A0ABT0K0V5_9ACTN|nr:MULTISPECIES: acyl carrier protein [Frankia]MCK9877439.1 acyl carrier protein [Frankia umida]MCK9923896.1 acyl carrier protein [Frankia sp. AgPm24]
MPHHWTADDLFTFLTEQAGLPPEDHPADLDVTFEDIGLDSLAYLQLSAEVADRFGVELPGEMPPGFTLDQILATVNDALGAPEPV